MCRSRLIATIVAASLILGSRGLAGDLVEGSDTRAKPIKQALAVLVKSIDSGDLEKARSAYAGTAADADLLKAYVDDVAAAKALRAAMLAKFGDHFRGPPRGFDSNVARMAVNDFNSVIFSDDPDRASSSADSPLGVGIEFKKVNGTWKVLSLASAPETAEGHLARLKKYSSTLKTISDKLKSGAYRTPDDAATAMEDAEDVLWPKKGNSTPTTGPNG